MKMVIVLYKCKPLWAFNFQSEQIKCWISFIMIKISHLLSCLTLIMSISVEFPIFKWNTYESSDFTSLASTCIMLYMFNELPIFRVKRYAVWKLTKPYECIEACKCKVFWYKLLHQEKVQTYNRWTFRNNRLK